MKWPDTQENSKHTILSDNTIGGQDFGCLSKPMYKAAESASSLKSTDLLHIPLISQ